MSIQDRIEQDIKNNRVMLYMKGTPAKPECGFSAQAVQLLRTCGAEFETANVLEDPELREGIKQFSNWPTVPQLYIDGEFIGGCDIMSELFRKGELRHLNM
jgi:monothiol glutaredoxin